MKPFIREIDRHSDREIHLVAARMRQTLVEVLGEEKGTALYSMEWLTDRVLWHLDAQQTQAKIFLIEGEYSEILGHAIARVERGEDGVFYGYFSTVYIDQAFRSRGMASALILHVESWFKSLGLSKIIYNTAENHAKLIRLFGRHGYRITLQASEMVQLTKFL